MKTHCLRRFSHEFISSRPCLVFMLLAGQALTIFAPEAYATTWTVCADGCDYTTIQAAIDNAIAGDTIQVNDAIHTESDIELDKSLTIQGNGPGSTIVQAHASPGAASDRVFKINDPVDVTLRDMTIRHGNKSGSGGAIYHDYSGILMLSHCTISSNSASGDGGAIRNRGGALEITACSIKENTADQKGGGIYHDSSGSLTVENSTFSGNYGAADAGGIYAGGPTQIVNSTFSGNGTGDDGGGLYNNDTATVTNCTFGGNSTAAGSDHRGGGIYVSSGTVNLRNTILAYNISDAGPDCYGTINSQDYNLIEDTSGCTILGTTTHNIYSVDAELGALGDNGGPTDTMALCKAGDTTGGCAGTVTDSPAIDRISPSSGACGSTAPYNMDQRGEARPYDAGLGSGDCESSACCDMGAYERTGSTLVELVRFEATPGSLSIVVEWETASEIDSGGFHLWRTESAQGTYEPITAEMIAAEGGLFWGASYTYEDLDVEMGRTYWYKLEDIDIFGRSTFHGPVETSTQSACGVVDGPADRFGTLWLLVLAVPAALVVAGRKKLLTS